MNQRFQNEEIKRVSKQYAENELYIAINSIGPQLESELKEFGLCPEECFVEVLELLSTIAEKGEDFLPDVENMWFRKSNEYRRLARQVERVNEEDICKAVGIVFGFTILAIDSSRHPFYRRTLSERLTQVIADHKFDGWASTLERIYSVPLPDGWFDAFIDEEEPVAPSSNRKRKSTKPEKQHGVEYLVFSKGSGVTNDHIKALYRLLTARGWISTQTKEVDFQRLFSGESNDCEIIWTGLDKQGGNEASPLGVSALYVLFKRMAEEKLITTGNKNVRVGPILESHFVDDKGHFLTSVSNVSTTSTKANDYIEKILKTMRMRPNSEDIQRLLQEDMDSRYDKNDRQDLGYRKPR